jgi:hypothetical protein
MTFPRNILVLALFVAVAFTTGCGKKELEAQNAQLASEKATLEVLLEERQQQANVLYDKLSKVDAIGDSLSREGAALKAKADSLNAIAAELEKKKNTTTVVMDPQVVRALKKIAEQPRVVTTTQPTVVSPPPTVTRTSSPPPTVLTRRDNPPPPPAPVTISVNELPATSAPEQPARIVPIQSETRTLTPRATATGSSQFAGQPDLLPSYEGDVYGDVSSKDPWDLQYDFNTGLWHYAGWINFPDDVVWFSTYDPNATYILGLGCIKTEPTDPVGTFIGGNCVEWTFRSTSADQRVNYPIRTGSPTSDPVGWGMIMPNTYCYRGTSQNGFVFNLSVAGQPTPGPNVVIQ